MRPLPELAPVEDAPAASTHPLAALPPLPYAYAKRHQVLLTHDDGAPRFWHGPDAPLSALLEVLRHCGHRLTPQTISADEFERRLQRCYEQGSGDAAQAAVDIGEALDLDQIARQLPEPEDLLATQDDAPVIRLINALLSEAIRRNASDIHIEIFEQRLAIRMRVDGILHDVLEPPRAIAPLLISRVKVMARLDIAEKRLPQDGRISLRVGGRPVDVRVSTLPSGHGERVVLRLLDKQQGRLDLLHLGMAPETLELLERLILKPHGILLVTGPTGSGKTTTLYAALSRISRQTRNILTVEDPIEYFLDGIGQTQVNPRVDMTFARGLRAILRQDPDVIMVGEIRDAETARTAVQASMTGHLVLSTLHTNSAISAITRLRDMGVEPYLLASSLIGVMSQRLVRLLCAHCAQPYHPDPDSLRQLGGLGPQILGGGVTLYTARGCAACNQTGYAGRTGVYEVSPVDDVLQRMIHGGASEQSMEEHARSLSPGIHQDCLRRLLSGDTSLEEIVRVIHT